jgi:hypothetical protein
MKERKTSQKMELSKSSWNRLDCLYCGARRKKKRRRRRRRRWRCMRRRRRRCMRM